MHIFLVAYTPPTTLPFSRKASRSEKRLYLSVYKTSQIYRISCFKFFSPIVLPIFLYGLKEIKRGKGIYIKPVVSPFELFKEKLINFCPITQCPE
jgi:hypothetical protein